MTNINKLKYFLKNLQSDLIFLASLVDQVGSKVSDARITCLEALTVCQQEDKKKDS